MGIIPQMQRYMNGEPVIPEEYHQVKADEVLEEGDLMAFCFERSGHYLFWAPTEKAGSFPNIGRIYIRPGSYRNF